MNENNNRNNNIATNSNIFNNTNNQNSSQFPNNTELNSNISNNISQNTNNNIPSIDKLNNNQNINTAMPNTSQLNNEVSNINTVYNQQATNSTNINNNNQNINSTNNTIPSNNQINNTPPKKKSNTKIIIIIIVIVLLIVILPVVAIFLISFSAVTNSMTSSKRSALQDTATSIAQSFDVRYKESLFDDTTNDIYGNLLGVGSGYDFTKPGAYEISDSLADELYISQNNYKLGYTNNEVTPTNITTSIVIFDGNTSIVCLLANPSGKYYVSNNKNNSVTINSTTYTFNSTGADKDDIMWSCSNNKNSWE